MSEELEILDNTEKRKENQKQVQAFQYYYSLQENRDMQDVADKFNVSLKTVYKWSSWYNWKERCEELDKQANKQMEAEAVNEVVECRKTGIGIINKAFKVFEKNLDNGVVKIISLKDLEQLVDIMQKVLGGEAVGAGGQFQFNVSNVSDEALNNIINNMNQST